MATAYTLPVEPDTVNLKFRRLNMPVTRKVSVVALTVTVTGQTVIYRQTYRIVAAALSLAVVGQEARALQALTRMDLSTGINRLDLSNG